MRYNFNGKELNIPDKEIENNMKTLDITQEEAIEMWLDDNDYTTNEVVENLTKKAKESGASKIVADYKPRAKREYVRKENPTKERIIAGMAHFLAQIDGIVDIKVTNIGKIIEFSCENKQFKLDLVEKRQKKG